MSFYSRLVPYIAALCVFLGAVFVTLVVADLEKQKHALEIRADVLRHLSGYMSRLETTLSKRLFLAQSIVNQVTARGEIEESDFVYLAGLIMQLDPVIKEIHVAPNSVISLAYPTPPRHGSIGTNLITDLGAERSARRVMESRKTYVSAPVTGGDGTRIMLIQVPLLMDELQQPLGQKRLRGLVQVVLDASRFFEESDLQEESMRVLFAIRLKEGSGKTGPMIFGDERIFQSEPITMEMRLPLGSWELAAMPSGGWSRTPASSRWLLVTGFAFATFLSIIAFTFARTPERLSKLVDERTAELRKSQSELQGARDELERRVDERTAELSEANVRLKAEIEERSKAQQELEKSEEKYRSIFEHSPLGIFHFNSKGIITACNDKFVRIIGSSKETLIGLDMIHRLDNVEIVGCIQMSLSGQVCSYEGQYRSVTADKTTPVKAYFTPMSWGDEENLGGIGIVEDTSAEIEAQRALEQRDRLLEALARGAQTLLISEHFSTAVSEFLAGIGEAAGVDRVYIFRNHEDPDSGRQLMSQEFEWARDSVTPQIENPELQNLPYEEGFERWFLDLGSGRPIRGLVRDFPQGERDILEPQDIVSICVVPIFIESKFWGLIGFDDCHVARGWSEMETAILLAAAGSIGGAFRRRITQEALQESEERYRRLVSMAKDLIYQTDPEGRFTLFNEVAVQLTGYSHEELMGFHYSALIHPDDREQAVRFYGRQFVTKTPDTYFECRILTKQHQTLWIGQNVQLIMRGDDVQGFQSICRDITDRKNAEEAIRQSEEKYRTIIENIEEGYYEVDLRGYVRFFNDAFCKIVNRDRGELVGMNYRLLVDPAQIENLSAVFTDVLKTGTTRSSITIEILKPDATKRTLEASVSLIRDADRKPVGFRGICKDVSEKKQTEELLLRSERLKAVGELASGIAHNFNNLLQIVMGGAQLAKSNLESGNVQAAANRLDQILHSAHLGSQTVRRLQSFSRLKSDFAREGRVFDLSETLRNAAEMSKIWWKSAPEKEGLTISLVESLEDGCLVHGRENELFEVVVNLIKNACEALPEGGTIEVATRTADHQVFLEVKDDGIGIAPQHLKKIFEPFFTTGGLQRTGMGLASSYGIVSEHGGDITVQSDVGKGTRFTVRLPFVVEKAKEAVIHDPAHQLRDLSFLVVDDVEFVVTLLMEGLAPYSQKVVGARSGDDAVSLFQQAPFDVILCDLGMPGMSGWDVGKKILDYCRENLMPKPIFIVLTGWGGQDEEEQRIVDSGVDAVVEKPVDIDKLLGTIDSVISQGVRVTSDITK